MRILSYLYYTYQLISFIPQRIAEYRKNQAEEQQRVEQEFKRKQEAEARKEALEKQKLESCKPVARAIVHLCRDRGYLQDWPEAADLYFTRALQNHIVGFNDLENDLILGTLQKPQEPGGVPYNQVIKAKTLLYRVYHFEKTLIEALASYKIGPRTFYSNPSQSDEAALSNASIFLRSNPLIVVFYHHNQTTDPYTLSNQEHPEFMVIMAPFINKLLKTHYACEELFDYKFDENYFRTFDERLIVLLLRHYKQRILDRSTSAAAAEPAVAVRPGLVTVRVTDLAAELEAEAEIDRLISALMKRYEERMSNMQAIVNRMNKKRSESLAKSTAATSTATSVAQATAVTATTVTTTPQPISISAFGTTPIDPLRFSTAATSGPATAASASSPGTATDVKSRL